MTRLLLRTSTFSTVFEAGCAAGVQHPRLRGADPDDATAAAEVVVGNGRAGEQAAAECDG